MKAAFLDSPKTMSLRDLPDPVCPKDKVVVRITHVGLCGSDLHYYSHGKLGDNVIREPHILGHEASGIIEETGSAVKEFRPGDRVVLEPGIPCGVCRHCRTGHYNLCEQVVFISVPGYPGALQEYMVYNPLGLFRIPDGVGLDQAALAEPLAVGYNAAASAGITAGSSVAILGAGPIGLSVLESARIMGAGRIMISDTNSRRLEIARLHGASRTVNVLKEDLQSAGQDFIGNSGFDFVIEATGVPASIEATVPLVKKGGTVVWVGLGEEETRISGYRMVKKQITLKGVYRYANQFAPVLELMAAKRFNLDDWISHRFSLEEISQAMAFAADPSTDKMKVMIQL